MKHKVRQDSAWLLATAKAIAFRLKADSKGTRIRIRIPCRAISTNTDGWRVTIGDLGKNQPRLEVWYDRFSGYPERKLYTCLWSPKDSKPILAITRQVSRKLWPIRIITPKEIDAERYFVLAKRLGRSEFNAPILEKYDGGNTFFGIYDQTRESGERVNPLFCNRAVAFFEDLARALPHSKNADEHRDVYPQIENRKSVVSHLTRERSRLLSTERKIKDDYKCQVCNMRFKDVYGIRLGQDCAEAHHLVPLNKLRENVKTRLEDLRTVCANCHRMLHRMDGKPDDIVKLRAIVRKHR